MKIYYQNILKNLGIRYQLFLVLIIGIVVLAISSSLITASVTLRELNALRDSQGQALADTFAEDSLAALLQQDTALADELTRKKTTFPNVAGARILNADGSTLSQFGAGLPKFSGYSSSSQPNQTNSLFQPSKDYWHFYAPVYRAGDSSQTLLGYVDFGFSKTTLAGLQRTILKNNLIVSSLIAAILLGILLAITNVVTRPIRTLSQLMNRASQGETDVRVRLTGSKEVIAIESAFNNMMETLASRETELKKAGETALASARLKGQFATTVSHELRTPMNGVMGMLELLQTMALSKEQRDYVNVARASGEELLLLIDDILDFSKIESGKLNLRCAIFNPRDMLKNIAELLQPQAQQKGLTFKVKIDDTVPEELAGDTGRIRQVLLNLIGNALKFTLQGGITIRMTANPDVTGAENTLYLSVEDTGIGIPPQAQQLIFEAFSQADGSTTRQFGGTGLGLAICQQLIELMGGKIAVTSEPGRGSQFWFTLPIQLPTADMLRSTIPLELIGLRILIVSRNSTSADPLINLLAAWDAHLRTATTANETLQLLKSAALQYQAYDAVVIDTPIADGKEMSLISDIASLAELPTTAIVLLSHSVHQELPAHCACISKLPSAKQLEKTFIQLLNPVDSAPHSTDPESKPQLGLHVLIVEDNKTNQMVAKRMVETLGCTYELAENGELAIAALEKSTFDVVLMDCNMPFMNGYTASQLIRGKKSKYQHIPVIALTATTDQLDIKRCYSAGMNDYLAKPLKLENLTTALSQFIKSAEFTATTIDSAEHTLSAHSHNNQALQEHPTEEQLSKEIADHESQCDAITMATPCLDCYLLENMRGQLGEGFADAINTYLNDTKEHLLQLNEAVSYNNTNNIRYFLHLIKSRANNNGASRLSDLCEQLEYWHDGKDFPNLQRGLTDLHNELEQVSQLLTEMVAQHTATTTANLIGLDKPYILITDDDNSSRIIMRAILEKDGYHIEEAHNGEEALAMCRQQMPDLILMDAMMPVMDGFIASEHILALECDHQPTILMITSLTDDGTLERAVAAGATDFILKPINMTILRQRVSRVIDTGHSNRHIHQLSYYDSLTSLPNRTFFVERGKLLIESAHDNTNKLAVLFLDLDRFKLINDSKGHDAGDILLKHFASRLKSCVAADDIVARLGGDEFTVILSNITQGEDAVIVANKILDSLQEPMESMERKVQISASIGIAVYPEDGETISELMKHADTAMFQAKEKGGKSYEFYQHGMELEINKQIELEIELKEALQNNEFELYYQPQIDLRTGELTGLEALIRWNHPIRGFVSPAEFIPFAEKSSLITQIGDWVLNNACKQQGSWLARGFEPVPIAVNVSGGELTDSVLLSKVENALRQSGIPASLIKLEITEDTLAGCNDQTIRHLHDLRELGTNLAIDDFGTGYSSLSYLKMFPVDTLKIDRSFIKDLPSDLNSAAIVTGIVTLGHSLKMQIVAEGVETEAQQHFLAKAGCDVMQGYLLSRPLPVHELEEWIINKQAHPGFLTSSTKVVALPRIQRPL